MVPVTLPVPVTVTVTVTVTVAVTVTVTVAVTVPASVTVTVKVPITINHYFQAEPSAEGPTTPAGAVRKYPVKFKPKDKHER